MKQHVDVPHVRTGVATNVLYQSSVVDTTSHRVCTSVLPARQTCDACVKIHTQSAFLHDEYDNTYVYLTKDNFERYIKQLQDTLEVWNEQDNQETKEKKCVCQ